MAVDLPAAKQADHLVCDLIGTLAAAMMQDQPT
jgi:hypothetical protein